MSNNIADDLIYGQNMNGETSLSPERKEERQEREHEKHEENNRVVSTRYKIYIVIYLLVGLLAFYQMILPARDTKKQIHKDLLEKKVEVESFQEKKTKVEDNVFLLKTIEKDEEKIVKCINTKKDCSKLSGLNKLLTGKNIGIVKSYLNLTSLSNKRMVINEKKILENLNDFLLRKDINKSAYNGEIEAIHIGEEDKVNEDIFYSPVDLRILFDDKDDLLSFVDNIEARILPKKESRILYQIENIKYDILKSQEKQSVDLSLNMFYTR